MVKAFPGMRMGFLYKSTERDKPNSLLVVTYKTQYPVSVAS